MCNCCTFTESLLSTWHIAHAYLYEWMKGFITKFTFNFYNHKREQNTNKITNLVTGSNKIAKQVKVGPIHKMIFTLKLDFLTKYTLNFLEQMINTSKYLHYVQNIYIMNKNVSSNSNNCLDEIIWINDTYVLRNNFPFN